MENKVHTWIYSDIQTDLPENAVSVGLDTDGNRIYVGRVDYEKNILPAKVVPGRYEAYFGWKGMEFFTVRYEILTGLHYCWIDASNLVALPACAVRAGQTDKGEALYVGRGYYKNSTTPGSVYANDFRNLIISYGGSEVTLKKYELLVQPATWILSSGSNIEPGAVCAGTDCNGNTIYVGSAYHKGEMLPAKIVPNKGCAYISESGKEYEKYEFQFLVGNGYCWIQSSNGNVPANAVACGHTVKGNNWFMGRAHYRGSSATGGINATHKCLYIPYDGEEIAIQEYEVLARCTTSNNDVLGPPISWVPSSKSNIGSGAVRAGIDVDSDTIYVGRCSYLGDLLPAKVIPNKGCAYVSKSGRELKKFDFEYLIGSGFSWVPESNGNVPTNAVVIGQTIDGEKLYMGRCDYMGSITPGKIHPSHQCLYIPYNGQEVSIYEYEVLINDASFGALTDDVALLQPDPWIFSTGSKIIPCPVYVDTDLNGNRVYVGRAYHQGELLPGKIIPSKSSAYICTSGTELQKDEFEFLVEKGYKWISNSNGNVPSNAIIGGYTAERENLYIGRCIYLGKLTPGKIQSSHKCLYISHNGEEIRSDHYEVLCR